MCGAVTGVLAGVLLLTGFAVGCLAPQAIDEATVPFAAGCALVGVLAFAAVAQRDRALAELLHSDSPLLVGPLSEMVLHADDPRDRSRNRRVLAALARLLPLLTPEDAASLTARQASALYGLITHRRPPHHERFVAAVLDSLLRTGDVRALPYVQAYARRLGPNRASDTAIEQAVRQCAESLGAEQVRQQRTRNLLRPAVAPDDELLLRPAHGPSTASEEQLLRAVAPECDDQ